MNTPTIVACLTPAGTGAIATIALRGPNAWPLVEPLFRARGTRLPTPGEPNRLWLGKLGEDWTDDVVLTLAGDSSEQRVEIHCHGGPAVVRGLLDLLGQRGAEEISWEEWLRRSNGSPLQAEAAAALGHALTLRTANILLDQYHGAMQRALLDLMQAFREGRSDDARKGLDELVGRIPLGRHLTKPWRVVLAGAPNVGKSSLLNALLGFQRSIISPMPGTTRDVVTALTAFDGWPVELADTAGLREPTASLEAEGIERAKAACAGADLCLWIMDGGAEPIFPSEDLGCAVLPVINKIDLPAAWPVGQTPWPERLVQRVSARTGQGIGELVENVARQLVPAPLPVGAAVPFTAALCEALLAADQHRLDRLLLDEQHVHGFHRDPDLVADLDA